MGRSVGGEGSGERAFLLLITKVEMVALHLLTEVQSVGGPWCAEMGIAVDDGP